MQDDQGLSFVRPRGAPQREGGRSLVVANRWDGLGGRLGAVTNAIAMAAALDASFGFTWRDVPGHLVNDPLLLFDRRFLCDHAVDEAWLEATPRLVASQLAAGPRREAAEMLRQPSQAAALVEIVTCFEALRFADEDTVTARARFARAWQRIEWSPRIASVIERALEAPLRTRTALHLRGGDVVDGSWGRVMHHDKYVPVLGARAAVRWAMSDEREHCY